MENNSELVRLEEFVDKLLTKFNTLQQAYSALEATLAERETECEKLKGTVSELRSERNVVGEKVTGLISRIEQWESEMGTGKLVEEDLAQQQGKLFQGRQAAAK